jgi:hypothetical protein
MKRLSMILLLLLAWKTSAQLCDPEEYADMTVGAGERRVYFFSAYNMTDLAVVTTDAVSGVMWEPVYSFNIYADANLTYPIYENANAAACFNHSGTIISPTSLYYMAVECRNMIHSCYTKMSFMPYLCDPMCSVPGSCGANSCNGVCSLCDGVCGVDDVCVPVDHTNSASASPKNEEGRGEGETHVEISPGAVAGIVVGLVVAPVALALLVRRSGLFSRRKPEELAKM